MGRVSQIATGAIFTVLTTGILIDPAHVHTSLVAAAVPTALFSATAKNDPRTVWAINAAFAVGLLLNDSYVAIVMTALVFTTGAFY